MIMKMNWKGYGRKLSSPMKGTVMEFARRYSETHEGYQSE